MKTNQNDQVCEVNSLEWSIQNPDDDSIMPEPDPVTMMSFWYDDEDEISDYSLMEKATGPE